MSKHEHMRVGINSDSLDERIRQAGWFPGTNAEWRALPLETRDELAFAATGCEVAYATWPAPVDCLHVGCRIRRGELPRIALTNAVLIGESHSGWLRFLRETTDGRKRLARIFRAVRAAARQTGVYDPWKLDWRVMVYPAITEES